MHTRRQAQAAASVSSLSLVLPHPPLPRRTSGAVRASQSSQASTPTGDDGAEPSPRTPRNSCGGVSAPSLFKLDSSSGAPRKSTDSWNSSNCDGGDDDMEWEWTPEQVALLNKTLDALPSHLLTPFNGPIPPPNVLDRISRSIIHAKDPLEWPHSVRSTRVKLLKLARSRGQEDQNQVQDADKDDDHDQSQVLKPANVLSRKPKAQPLYRQSSMDFLKGNTLNHEKSIDRLSSRLQRVDRTIPNPAGNPYTYSPPPALHSAASASASVGNDSYPPSTPTSGHPHPHPLTGLQHRSSASSLSSIRGPRLRRSTTTISGLPTIHQSQQLHPPQPVHAHVPSHLQQHQHQHLHVPPHQIRRSGSFSSPGKNGLGHSLKRAPSFGTLSTRSSSSRMSVDVDSNASVGGVDDEQKENSPAIVPGKAKGKATPSKLKPHPPAQTPSQQQQQQQLDIYPSSDDEEKARSKKVKKPRVSPSSTTTSSATKTKSVDASLSKVTSSSTLKSTGAATPKGSVRSRKTSSTTATGKGARTTRASSIFGAELPHPQPDPPTPSAHLPIYSQTYAYAQSPPPIVSPPTHPRPHPYTASPTTSPTTTRTKTLRRIKTTSFPRGAAAAHLSRRISFGSLKPSEPQLLEDAMEDAMEEVEADAEMKKGGEGLGSAFQLL